MELYLKRELQTNLHNEWIRISKDEIKLNRCVTANIRLYSTYVSREHVVLQNVNGIVCISDHGSTYGILINNARITNFRSYPLKQGDVIEIAKPPLEDPVWSKLTIDDRFIYRVYSATKSALDKCKPGPRQHNSALFMPKNNKKFDQNDNIAQNIFSKKVSVKVHDIGPNLKFPSIQNSICPSNTSKTLRVSLDKSQAIENIVVEQENKRLKMELEKKQTEINDKDDKIECLKQTSSETVEKLVDAMESELQCTICSEIFIKSVTLNCTHTFCEFCITQWKKVKQECPMCRVKILTATRTLFVDNYIEKVVLGLSKKFQDERKELVDERKKAFDEYNESLRNKQKHRTQNTAGRGRGRGGRRRGRRNNNVINTGIPIIRVQNITHSSAPQENEPILIDSQSSTQFESTITPSTSGNNDNVIVIS